MTVAPPNVFISYSHEDEAWKDRLVSHLSVLGLEGALEVWDDRRIAAGDEWRLEIEKAIERATVAILIVSKDFLTSRFIREQELTKILAGRTTGHLRVIPLIAEPCAWQEVSVLRGIQARPQDGRPLSAGTEHQIDADLAELAVEVVKGREHRGSVPAGPADARLVQRGSRMAQSTWLAASLGGSCLLASLLTLAATYWPVTTAVSLDFVTERVSFAVRGTRQVFDPGLEFSRLTIERCASATFEGVDVVDPAGPPTPPLTRLTCRDPEAKITLAGRGDAPIRLGIVPPVNLEPGATVAIDVADGRTPVLTLDLSGQPFRLDVPIEHDLDVLADLVDVEPIRMSGRPGLVRYAGTRSDAPRHVMRLETSDRGVVLVAALAGGSLRAAFPNRDRVAVDSIRVDKETRSGVATTALLGDGSLSYLDYPTMPPLSIPKDNAIVLERMSGAQLRELRLASARRATGGERPAIRLAVEGNLIRGAIGLGDPGRPEHPEDGRWSDARLTLYDVLTHGRLLMAAMAGGWTVATLWAAYLGWRRLSL